MTDVSPSPAASAMASAAVSHEEFLLHIKAMQQQYRGIDSTGVRPIISYALPARLVALVPPAPQSVVTPSAQSAVPAAEKPVPAEMISEFFTKLKALGTPEPASHALAEAMQQLHQDMVDLISSHRATIVNAIGTAQKSANTKAFVEQMEALAAKAKADHEARIDAIYNRLISLSAAHPSARPVLLTTGNKVGGFVAGLSGEVVKVTNTVKSVVSSGVAAIGKATETVGQWAAGAAKRVGDFFRSLF